MENVISNIVFSKNRPLQLDAYLESLYRCLASELIKTYILYKVELFEEEYALLFQKYPQCVVVKEDDFFSNFLSILSDVNTKYVLFGVDDVVYFDSVDFEVIEECFTKFDEDIFGFSLRFGEQSIRDSNDPIGETVIAGQTVYRIDWRQGRTPTTRYPFELCSTIYPTALVRRVIDSVMNNNPVIKKLFSPSSALVKAFGTMISARSILKSFGYFFNPNTLESWSCRWCQNHSEQLPGFLYFQNQCASAIQVNMVNVTQRKILDGSAEHTVEALSEYYRQGYRLDVDFVARNKPVSTHSGQECFRLTKN